MQLKDGKRFFALNTDDHPSQMVEGDVSDALNIRMGSSDSQHESGIAETLQGELGVLINPDSLITYYGSAIGGQFVYPGYAEIAIGSQVWMKKNWDAKYPGSKVYNDDENNRDVYGGLYTHGQIMASDFCPDGWHIPTEAEVDILIAELLGEAVAGGKLKDIGWWDAPNTGADDSSGFKAMPGGGFGMDVMYYGSAIGSDNVYDLLGSTGLLWLADEVPDVIPPMVLAGTSPSSLILKSINNGVTFASEGSEGLGNPTCFCQLSNGDILYGTDTGYVVNYTKGTSSFISSMNHIYSIAQATDGKIYVGEAALWVSIDNGVTFTFLYSGLFIIEQILPIPATKIVLFKSTFVAKGIYVYAGASVLKQVGYFTSACDAGGGVIYAGDFTGHIWKSVDYGETWSDLGVKLAANPIYDIALLNSGRIIITDSASNCGYTDNNFATAVTVVTIIDDMKIIKVQDNIVVGATKNGRICRSIDNGATFTEITGNPQQGESSINCLINIA